MQTEFRLPAAFALIRIGIAHRVLLAASVAFLQSPAMSQTTEDFVGNWINVYPETRAITRIVLTKSDEGSELIVHGFGACSPECDWGEIRIPFTGNPLVGVYDFGFKTATLTMCLASPGLLFIHADNIFQDGRDYVNDQLFHRDANPPLAGGDASAFVGDWFSLYPEDKDLEASQIDTIRILRTRISAVAGNLEISVHAACQPRDCPAADGTATVVAAGNPFTADIDFRTPEGVSWGNFKFTFQLFEGDLLHVTGMLWENALHRAESPAVCYVPPRPSFHRSDIDGNGVLNISDAISLLGSLFLGGASSACLESADTDNDAAISLTDAIYILNHLFLSGPRPVAPGPPDDPCGPDPDPPGSVGDLGCESYAACR